MPPSSQVGTVYGLKTADSKIMYVGQTMSPLKYRLSSHLSGAKNGSPDRVHEWIRAVGVGNVEIVALEAADQDQLVTREVFWTLKLKTLTVDGGLNDRLGRSLTGEALTRRQELMREITQRPDVRAKLSATHKKRYEDPAERAKQSAGNVRRYKDPAERAKSRRSLRLGNHNRWHRDRGLVSPDCEFCDYPRAEPPE